MGTDVSRRTVLGLIAGQVAAASISKAIPLPRKAAPRPNVVFLLADDVGYGDLACLGNPVIKTPNLDDMHAKGIRFTDFHVSPTCAPTRASLMTGKYCDATGVWHTIMGRSLLDPRDTTLAECFRSSGYKTAIYGKWHLGDNYPCRPQDLGFDDVVVCGGGGIAQTPDYFGNDDLDDSYLHNGTFQKYTGFSTDIFFDLTMDFMTGASKEGKPFFCYLPTTAAHEPCWSKESDAAPYVGVKGLSSPGFYGMIANIDENLGRLMRFLKDYDLSENTIVMYAGDNGSQDGVGVYNTSMRGEKGSPYEGGHRVPLFMYWPAGGLTGGRDIETLAAHIDILPTLAELCQLKNRGKDLDGVSLCPLLYSSREEWKDRAVVVDSQREEHLTKWKDTAVMTQRWRLVNPSPDGDLNRIELFDLPRDSDEETDVASKHPDVVRSLMAQYDAWWNKVSIDGNKYVRIVLGSDQENPSRLTCMDWHTDDAGKVWNQTQIRTAPVANGFWTVDISRPGNYKFELRRWPRELDLPINAPYAAGAPYKNGRSNRDKTPGVAIAAVKARILIGDIDHAKAIPDGSRFVEFTLPLSPGPAELRTTFYDADENPRGAYYVYVERA
jgi:arylsulfatase A-like enzyme